MSHTSIENNETIEEKATKLEPINDVTGNILGIEDIDSLKLEDSDDLESVVLPKPKQDTLEPKTVEITKTIEVRVDSPETIQKLAHEMAKREALEQIIAQLKNQNQVLIEELEKSRNGEQLSNKTVSSYKLQLEQRDKSLSNTESRVQELNDKILKVNSTHMEECSTLRKQLENEVDAQLKQKKMNDSLQNQLQLLNRKLSKAEEVKYTIESSMLTKDKEVHTLQRQIERANAREKHLMQELDSAQRRCSNLRKDVSTMRASNIAHKSITEKTANELQVYQRKLREMTGRLSHLEGCRARENDANAKTIMGLRTELNKAKVTIKRSKTSSTAKLLRSKMAQSKVGSALIESRRSNSHNNTNNNNNFNSLLCSTSSSSLSPTSDNNNDNNNKNASSASSSSSSGAYFTTDQKSAMCRLLQSAAQELSWREEKCHAMEEEVSLTATIESELRSSLDAMVAENKGLKVALTESRFNKCLLEVDGEVSNESSKTLLDGGSHDVESQLNSLALTFASQGAHINISPIDVTNNIFSIDKQAFHILPDPMNSSSLVATKIQDEISDDAEYLPLLDVIERELRVDEDIVDGDK